MHEVCTYYLCYFIFLAFTFLVFTSLFQVAMALSLQRYTWSDFSSGLHPLLKERIKKGLERSKLVSIAIKNGDRLPENLLIEILSWLPVKDVLQYKSVCKSWYAIISSPQFISKHLKNNRVYDENCLLAQYYVSHAELQLFELLVDEGLRVLGHEVLYGMPMYGSYVCGPCDGLYYLYEYDFSGRALWNPAINELKTLPPIIEKPDPPANTTYAKSEVYGFGVDPKTGDYKVVVIKGYWSTNDEDVSYPLSVLVYSLKTNTWKYCGDLAREYNLENNKCYVFVKGCCFWTESYSQDDENSEAIISFDMATDSFQEIHVPDYQQPASKCLGMFDDSLAFFSVHDDEKNLDVWTLNQGIWTKKFSIGPFPEVQNPVGHWNGNKVLLECEGRKLALCDPSTQEIKDLGFERDLSCQGIFAYMESLVSIKHKTESNEGEEIEANVVDV
ncbi:F-box protein At3g08750-like isoform X2 [Silene latifolia]|uniref:F-box protein At3g08750-like isoform X2 n=1 Tax=Silene latifolia TaxID=37657 RepID=UPI003D78230C